MANADCGVSVEASDVLTLVVGSDPAAARRCAQSLNKVGFNATTIGVAEECDLLIALADDPGGAEAVQQYPAATTVITWSSSYRPAVADLQVWAIMADYVLPLADLPLRSAELQAAASRRAGQFALRDNQIAELKSTLGDLRKVYASLDSDLAEAKKLQQSLLRDRGMTLGPVQMSLLLQSSGPVGGDLVGHFPIDAHRFGFFALDVSGHGVTSALMAVRMAGHLSPSNPYQNIAVRFDNNGHIQPRDPAKAVTDFNLLVLEDIDTEHYFTLILGHVDTRTGVLKATQAGHPHPVLHRRDGTMRDLGAGGLPVGMINCAEYETFEVQLEPGDRFVVLSDGFIEAPIGDDDFLSEVGVKRLLHDARDLSTDAVLESMVWQLSQETGDTEFHDDLSGVLIEMSDRA